MDATLGLGGTGQRGHGGAGHDHPRGSHDGHPEHDHAGDHDAHDGHDGHDGHGSSGKASEHAAGLQSDTAKRMADAATTFLAALDAQQRKQATFAVDNDERRNWHYVPKDRLGLPLKDMDTSQQQLAFSLLATGLSRQGYSKAMRIMSLEKVLGGLEGTARRFPRDPELYYVTVFGTPSDDKAWGWRVEGHHVSVNFLVVEGDRIAPTPNFFGSNPARVPSGALEGMRILAAEEDLARHVLGLLSGQSKRRAVIAPEAPADILTRAEHHVHLDAPTGLSVADMDEAQKDATKALLHEYVERMPEDVAEARINQILKAGAQHIHFAWAGPEKVGEPHYYRLQGPSFLVEYDNTQNGANHIHSVWRDVEGDWGDDLLADHYAKSH